MDKSSFLFLGKQSNIPIRLVSPYPGLDFVGRVEVYHNNEWGTICDDLFGSSEANVVCQMLNFTRGALCYNNYPFGQGTGRSMYCMALQDQRSVLTIMQVRFGWTM